MAKWRCVLQCSKSVIKVMTLKKMDAKKGVLCKLRTIQSKKSLSNPSYFKEKKTTYPELIIHSWWVLFNKSTIICSNISVMRILLQHVNFLFDLFLFILG